METVIEFESGFMRSRRGNLWRQWEGMTLTVFERHGCYRWCIARANGNARFSPCAFDYEEEALRSLAAEMGLGEPLPELD